MFNMRWYEQMQTSGSHGFIHPICDLNPLKGSLTWFAFARHDNASMVFATY